MMDERADGRPDQWARLWDTVGSDGPPHVLETSVLGEYAVAFQERGAAAATRMFPAVVAHLATDCGLCAADLRELLAFAAEEQRRRVQAQGGLRWRYGVRTSATRPSLPPYGPDVSEQAANAAADERDNPCDS